MPRCERLEPAAIYVTNGNKTGAADLTAAEEVGVALRNTSTSNDGEVNHIYLAAGGDSKAW